MNEYVKSEKIYDLNVFIIEYTFKIYIFKEVIIMTNIIEKLIKEFKEVAEQKAFIYVSFNIPTAKSENIREYKFHEEIKEGTHLETFLEKMIKKGCENIAFYGYN